MPDLFDQQFEQTRSRVAPLADRMRPQTFEEFVGQEHIVEPLKGLVASGTLNSLILWGPPGSGKTTLARLIAKYTKAFFVEFSAVTAGVGEVRKICQEAADRIKYSNRRTILFVDEIHRFNKAQQDAFLPFVENGTIILIGATTENPGFEVNAPLLSRAQLLVLNQLTDEQIHKILETAIAKAYPDVVFDMETLNFMVLQSNGDGRTCLNALENAVNLAGPDRRVTVEHVAQAIQKKAALYDKKGDQHYDVISAFIKSLRGSDPDAALYYMARMIRSGEDPKFICRRMVILASEDVGNADPQALVLATNCMQAVHMVGMPEAALIMAQTATYLASCPKSNASYEAINKALATVDEARIEPVPIHLRNAPTKVAKQLGHGRTYKYPHTFGGYVKQQYLPDNIKDAKFYFPKEIGYEKKINEFLKSIATRP
ncbi:replication-associated recombination protein A [Candidatus Berkelbacteria bacterium]|nr:replication-associated recombination protein A [Candidatus Berkelbacteria bacterium]